MTRRFRLHLFDSCLSKDNTAYSPLLRRSGIASPPRPYSRLAPVVSTSSCCRRQTTLSNVHRSIDTDVDDLPLARETPAYLWREEEKWRAIDTVENRALFPSPVAAPAQPRQLGNKRELRSAYTDGHDLFSSDEGEEEMEMLRSNSTTTDGSLEAESVAVVKQSKDPRADFRGSMMEMVVEKGIYEADGLEQLLYCFLSLNSKQHHGAILTAFMDVWEVLFPATQLRLSPTTDHFLAVY